MRNEKCMGQSAIGVFLFILLILSLSGCGGGGSSSQIVEGPPSTPTGVQVVISASNELTLSWSSVGNATSYNIYWSTAPGANKKSTKLSGTTLTNYVHKPLASGSINYYVVTAVNSFGESSESVEVFALLATPYPPRAVAAVAGDGKVTVSWSTNGAISYNIYMASQSGVTKANFATLTDGMVHFSTGSSYTHTGLVNGKTYYFVVTSVNGLFGEGSESSEVAVTPAASSTLLTVSGLVKYEDKQYGISGFTGSTFFKAVRFAEVQAVDAISGAIIANGTTDGTGFYTLTIPSASLSKAIYIRAIASTLASTLSPAIGVKDFANPNALHAVAGADFSISGAAMADISIPVTSLAAGAFNILDVYTSGAQFIQSLTGSFPPALTAFWQAGNPIGTYFCGVPDPAYCPYVGIYILNYLGDTDEYDDDVLWHEYGHFIASNYSKDDSPGGVHYISSNDLDLRLSWSEGWGDFFPSAVKTWLNATTPSLLSTVPLMSSSIYVDTAGASGSYFDFGNPGGYPYYYSSSEAAVAKVLVGLNTNNGMKAVWDTFTSVNIKNATTPINFEVFWNAWKTVVNVDITAILSDRLIIYSADTYEAIGDNTPNSLRKAVIGVAEDHTLFGNGDIDNIAFDATTAGQTITVRTTALKNGADTVISIIAPGSSVIAANDNTNGLNYANSVPNNCFGVPAECHENGSDILGSTVKFTATAVGTYYVEVKSSPNKPLSAGQYGGYSLTITSP